MKLFLDAVDVKVQAEAEEVVVVDGIGAGSDQVAELDRAAGGVLVGDGWRSCSC